MMATSSSRTRRPSPHSVPIAPILEQQPFANAAKHIQRTRAVDRFLMNEQLAFRTLKSLVRDEMPFSCETDWPETATQTPHARNEKFSAFEMAKTKCRWDEQRLSVLQVCHIAAPLPFSHNTALCRPAHALGTLGPVSDCAKGLLVGHRRTDESSTRKRRQ
jgi:hypothetical protein